MLNQYLSEEQTQSNYASKVSMKNKLVVTKKSILLQMFTHKKLESAKFYIIYDLLPAPSI